MLIGLKHSCVFRLLLLLIPHRHSHHSSHPTVANPSVVVAALPTFGSNCRRSLHDCGVPRDVVPFAYFAVNQHCLLLLVQQLWIGFGWEMAFAIQHVPPQQLSPSFLPLLHLHLFDTTRRAFGVFSNLLLPMVDVLLIANANCGGWHCATMKQFVLPIRCHYRCCFSSKFLRHVPLCFRIESIRFRLLLANTNIL